MLDYGLRKLLHGVCTPWGNKGVILACSPEKDNTARIGGHGIYNDDVARLHDRLATGRLMKVWAWMVDI